MRAGLTLTAAICVAVAAVVLSDGVRAQLRSALARELEPLPARRRPPAGALAGVERRRVRAGEEADRPILLEIGAVWCRWCHEMDRESYADPEIAALVNALFVPVKVDRDLRPDIDQRYQRAVSDLNGSGGRSAGRWRSCARQPRARCPPRRQPR